MDKTLLERLFLVSFERIRYKWPFNTGGRQHKYWFWDRGKVDHDHLEGEAGGDC